MICSVMRKDNSPCLELHRGALLCLTHADHGALCALLLVIVLFQNKRGEKKKTRELCWMDNYRFGHFGWMKAVCIFCKSNISFSLKCGSGAPQMNTTWLIWQSIFLRGLKNLSEQIRILQIQQKFFTKRFAAIVWYRHLCFWEVKVNRTAANLL